MYLSEKMMTAHIEAHYLPSLEYFCAILPFQAVCLEADEHFVKQTYRNRCYILTAQGPHQLTVPLAGRHGKLHTREVQVDSGNTWRNIHWRTLESAYRKAPFYEHYEGELKNILFRGHDFLLDLNRELLSFCLRHLRVDRDISVSVAYEPDLAFGHADLRMLISDKKSFATRTFYRPTRYTQVFGSEFVSNLSLIDLLFCEGPRSMSVLSDSAINLNK